MKRCNGFSLLELVVVVAILAIGMVGVVQAMVFAGRMAEVSKDIFSAVIITEEKFQQFELLEEQNILPQNEFLETEQIGKFQFAYQMAPVHTTETLKLWTAHMAWRDIDKKMDFYASTYFR